MATSRRTGAVGTESISTYGDATRDYQVGELSVWESATDNDNVTGNVSPVLECYNDAASYNDYVILAGSTNDATRFRIIRPAPGSGSNGSNWHGGLPTAGVKFVSTTDANIFDIAENYTQVQDIVGSLTTNSSTAGFGCFSAVGAYTQCVFVGCMAVDSLNSGTGFNNGFNLGTGTPGAYVHGAVDCLAHNNERYGFNNGLIENGCKIFLYNCDCISNTYRGVRVQGQAGSTLLLTNVLSTANPATTDFIGTSAGTVTVTYCSSGDATADDWGVDANRINQTFTFINSGADNFHLTSSDAGALNYGTSLAADGTYPFDDDIDKSKRPEGTYWDIGFDEYIDTAYLEALHQIGQPTSHYSPTIVSV